MNPIYFGNDPAAIRVRIRINQEIRKWVQDNILAVAVFALCKCSCCCCCVCPFTPFYASLISQLTANKWMISRTPSHSAMLLSVLQSTIILFLLGDSQIIYTEPTFSRLRCTFYVVNAAHSECEQSVVAWERETRGQSNLTKSASRGAHSPVSGHPRGSKVVPLNSWGRVSY